MDRTSNMRILYATSEQKMQTLSGTRLHRMLVLIDLRHIL